MTTSDPNDTLAYIGFVNYFSKTAEAYVKLQRRYPLRQFEISQWFDSIIDDRDNYRRIKLYPDSVTKYFDLRKLDRLLLYDGNYAFRDEVRFKQVVWEKQVWDENFGNEQFAAVYNGGSSCMAEPCYVISPNASERVVDDFYSQIIHDADRDKRIITGLKMEGEPAQILLHRKTFPSEVVYSIVSAKGGSYIVESDNKYRNKVVFMSADVEIYYLLPIPLMVNKKPLLLMSAGNPNDPEMRGEEYLLTYNGDSYVFVEANRISTKLLDR